MGYVWGSHGAAIGYLWGSYGAAVGRYGAAPLIPGDAQQSALSAAQLLLEALLLLWGGGGAVGNGPTERPRPTLPPRGPHVEQQPQPPLQGAVSPPATAPSAAIGIRRSVHLPEVRAAGRDFRFRRETTTASHWLTAPSGTEEAGPKPEVAFLTPRVRGSAVAPLGYTGFDGGQLFGAGVARGALWGGRG